MVKYDDGNGTSVVKIEVVQQGKQSGGGAGASSRLRQQPASILANPGEHTPNITF